MHSASNENLTEKAEHEEELPYGADETEYVEADDVHNNKAPPPPRFYKRRGFWTFCIFATIIFLAILIPIIILVVLPKIVQLIVNNSTMSLAQLNMTEATETSTKVSLTGTVGNAGIFSATIDFPEPIAVAWEGRSLGSMTMSSIKASGGQGSISEKTTFLISDKDAFSDFAKKMMSVESFIWTLTTTVNVRAVGRTIRGIHMVKDIKMLGMNGFSNITINSFDLPGDAPNNTGAYVRLVTSMNNPSPIGLDLGTIGFDLFFNGTYLGQVQSKNAVLVGDSASTLALEGVLIRHTNQTDLDTVSLLMSNYLAGNSSMTIGKGVFVKPDGVNAVSWLSNGILALTLNVPLKPPTALNIISDINIKDMGMVFDPAKPYQPLTSSSLLTAAFKLPFNITTSMKNVSNSMTLLYKDIVVGDVSASVWSEAQSNPGANVISFSLPPSPFIVKDDAKEVFNGLMADLTLKPSVTFSIRGVAGAVSDTPFGILKLTGIPFASNVTLKGIEFNSINADVSNVVISGGTSDHIVLNEQLAVPNPSALSFSSGSATLTVYDKETDQFLGELFFPAMKLVPGANSISTQFLFHPKNETLRDSFVAKYLVGGESLLKAIGTKDSTQSLELQQAFSQIALASTAPGMSPPPKLILSGTAKSNLNTVFGNRQTTVQIRMLNPMYTDLFVTGLEAQVYLQGTFFGTVKATYNQLVGPKAEVQTPEMIMQSPQGFDFGNYMITKLLPQYPKLIAGGENIPFDLYAVMYVRVGGANGYTANIHYNQQQQIFVSMTM
ncbi:hypothetical protein BGZ75_009865 [Mortierella antarctica]|nr:hypothetical protein BGZ75_009865 [Mortierella antarctica]